MKNFKRENIDLITIFLIICGAILFITGLFYKIPTREFSFYGIKEYVGGDAYNGIIEASIRGGEIAGRTAAKALYICSGLIIIALSTFRLKLKK